MKRKIIRCLWIGIFVLLVTITGVYLGLAHYYSKGFSFGTYINGVYCTGKSIDEINREMINKCTYSDIEITDLNGTPWNISMEDINYTVDFTEELDSILRKQNPYLWGQNLFLRNDHIVYPDGTYEEGKLEEAVKNLTFVQDTLANTEREVLISLTPEGYALVDQKKNVLQVDKLLATIKLSLSEGHKAISLSDTDCYQQIEYTDADRATFELWDKVSKFQDFYMIYDFGDSIEVINEGVVANWITLSDTGEILLDPLGEPYLDVTKLETYVQSLTQKYDTYGKKRKFLSIRGDEVTIDGGTYGNELDVKAEVKYLTTAFTDRLLVTRVPQYIHKALYQGSNDLGDTFVEIDLKNQHLYFHKDGEVVLDTPVVTGNVRWNLATPSRACFIVGKYKNRILRGPGYASHVDYWVPIYKNIGIHDANWRKEDEFGGEIYKTNGSHGCVNVPPSVMEGLFEELEVGIPVVMYYD